MKVITVHRLSLQFDANQITHGKTEQQVRENLMFTSDKIGGLMAVAARSDEQKLWFGATPPDLTIIARARGEAGNAGAGADWLYTYLRSFYRDANRPTGWNNVVFENVGMPHILYGLQGQQVLNHETHKLELAVPGAMAPAEFDKAVSDLVGFMVWMAVLSPAFSASTRAGSEPFRVASPLASVSA